MQNFQGLLTLAPLKAFRAGPKTPQLFSPTFISLRCGYFPRDHQKNGMPKSIQATAMLI